MQHRDADAVTRFKRIVSVDENAFELGNARIREDIERQVAQVAVVALVEDQGHRG